MTKAMKKNIAGKNTEAAASASTPIIWPSIDAVYGAEQRLQVLLSIIGARKRRNVFQREGVSTWCFPLTT